MPGLDDFKPRDEVTYTGLLNRQHKGRRAMVLRTNKELGVVVVQWHDTKQWFNADPKNLEK